jgi:hypothetical protein
MAKIKTQNEPTIFPTKHKINKDLIPKNNQENHSNKSQKLEFITNNLSITQDKTTEKTHKL